MIQEAIPSAIDHPCSVCGNTKAELHHVPEQMIGLGELFPYVRCVSCGLMELTAVPIDLSRFYPNNYYSLQPCKPERTLFGWTRRLAILRNQSVVFQTGGVGGWLSRFRGSYTASQIRNWLEHSPVRSFSARVLDVGCGQGQRLCRMHEIGYSNLTGIDPYIKAHRVIQSGLTIRKQTLLEVDDGPYDLIMMHHSLEHMPDHLQMLRKVRDLLAPGGACLIRIPIASESILNRYGTCWVEWDAPRHLLLHTEKSFRWLAQQVGLRILRVDWDSDRFACWASELYRRGMSLIDPATNEFRRPTDYFTPAELTQFDELAREDNRLKQASRAAFWLVPERPS